MSTLFLALRLFLLTLGHGLNSRHRLAIARRLGNAALFQDLGPVHRPWRQSLWFGFFTLKRAKDK